MSTFADDQRRQKAVLQSVYYASDSAIFIIDVDEEAPEAQRFVFADNNPAHERFSGMRAEWLRGRTPEDLGPLVPDAVISQLRANYQRCYDTRAPIRYDEVIPIDGRLTHWTTNLTPLFDEAGRLYRIVGTATNLDEVQAMREAQRAAEEASRAKGAFVASVSHEIRTPLNAIIGFAEVLHEMDLGEEAREFTGILVSSAETLLRLINDVLDFSKMEADRLDLEQSPFDVHACIEEAANLFASQAHRKGLELLVYVDPSVPTYLTGDAVRLRQIVMNLVANAVKFTAEGEVEVRATSTSVSGGVAELHVSVRDTGIGIGADKLEHVFDAFYQADGSTTRAHGGTGLGLAIVRRLAEQMNGQVWAESEVGTGSTFHVTALLPPARRKRASRRLAKLDGHRILVVDDNETNRRLLSLQLQEEGVAVTTAARGAEALRLLRKHPPFDLLLVDVQMPGMGGAGFVERVRARYAPETLPILLLSSVGVPDGVAERLVQGRLVKPIRRRALLEAVGRALAVAPAGTLALRTPTPEATSSGPARQPRRVLVVEDEPTSWRMLQTALRRLGYEADHAPSGDAALDAAEQQAYDFVLMDVMMPGMDGLEATRRLLRRARRRGRPTPPIIGLTARAGDDDVQAGLKAGMADYVAKPFRLTTLHAALRRTLRHHQAGSQGAAS